MGTTPNLGIPYPENSDLVTNGAAAMQAIAEAVDGENYSATMHSSTTGFCELYRRGGIVACVFDFTATAGIAAATVIAPFPADWCPPVSVHWSGFNLNTLGPFLLATSSASPGMRLAISTMSNGHRILGSAAWAPS